MVGIIILASAIAKTFFPSGKAKGGGHSAGDWHASRVDATQRAEALKTYERLAKEKLDVIKTAVAMGYSENELANLDARLEKLIGADKLKSMLNKGDAPEVDTDLLSADLDAELERLRRAREKSRK